MQQQSNLRAYIILAVIGTILLVSYVYLLRGMLTLNHPPPQALATSTISAMYKREVNLSSRCDPSSPDVDGQLCMSRLINYCAVDNPTGTEGTHSSIPSGDWRLEHLVLNIRHGDRSAIHRIDKSFKPSPYEGVGDLNSGKLMQRLRVASKFRVGPLPAPSSDSVQDAVTSEGFAVYNYNPVDSFMEVADRNLYSGQLTTIGFYQHILLGEHLNHAYTALLNKIQEPASSPLIAIRSTSYNRTIQSVAAMLSSFLPPLVHYSDVNIRFQPHSSLENMHGFVSNKIHTSGKPTLGGQISVHNDMNSPAVEPKRGKSNCPRAIAALKRMSASYDDTKPDTFQRLSNIYSPPVMERYGSLAHITEVADPLMTSFCHQEKYPCGQESRKCGSESLLRAVMIEADQSFCERYTSVYGGLEYTKLDIYPFLTEVKDALVEAAEAAHNRPKGSTNERLLEHNDKSGNRRPLVHVFSGHDTVIAPVLTALGIYQHSSYCNWPNYASRIAFEAWSPVGKNAKKFSKSRTGNKVFSVKNSNIHVRVVYNGEDVTGHIPACGGSSTVHYGKKQGGSKASLCPLELFVKQIESNLGSYDNLEDACHSG